MKNLAGAAVLALSVALTIAAGCTKSASEGGNTSAADIAAGKAVYDANGCARCHGGGRAPDLTKAGAQHDAAWLTAHVKNPKTHNPGSRMPAYEGKISEKDLTALGNYLASLK